VVWNTNGDNTRNKKRKMIKLKVRSHCVLTRANALFNPATFCAGAGRSQPGFLPLVTDCIKQRVSAL